MKTHHGDGQILQTLYPENGVFLQGIVFFIDFCYNFLIQAERCSGPAPDGTYLCLEFGAYWGFS